MKFLSRGMHGNAIHILNTFYVFFIVTASIGPYVKFFAGPDPGDSSLQLKANYPSLPVKDQRSTTVPG